MSIGRRDRYRVEGKLGDGTFGRVLACYDRERKLRIAVKVIRDIERYVKNAKVEAEILSKIHHVRCENRHHQGGRGVVRYFGDFFHDDRIYCLKFERLGYSLYQLIKTNNYRGFHMHDLQVISREFLETLDFLHSCCGLVHTDIKMENIMLTSSALRQVSEGYMRPILTTDESRGAHRSIRIIDFGNAIFKRDHHPKTINTRQYRSPEVILEQGWDEKSDMWSAGCVIAELFTGELLFPTHENMEHLAMIERVTETRFDRSFFSFSPPQVKKRFSNTLDDSLNWPDGCLDSASFRRVDECQPLHRMFSSEPELGNLVAGLLRSDPRRRYAAERALRHEFFERQI